MLPFYVTLNIYWGKLAVKPNPKFLPELAYLNNLTFNHLIRATTKNRF